MKKSKNNNHTCNLENENARVCDRELCNARDQLTYEAEFSPLQIANFLRDLVQDFDKLGKESAMRCILDAAGMADGLDEAFTKSLTCIEDARVSLDTLDTEWLEAKEASSKADCFKDAIEVLAEAGKIPQRVIAELFHDDGHATYESLRVAMEID